MGVLFGMFIPFWYDNWLDSNGRLFFDCVIDTTPRPIMVSAIVNNRGDWDWNRLKDMLPVTILERLAACPPPKPHHGVDDSGWRWDDNRHFTVCSAYRYLIEGGARNIQPKWKFIWSLKVPQRVRVLM
ncbi:hypothetical protein V6N12_073669 [Hibiscus sabdariffa]|uniref:Uncharacterized protein n=1 Tax=Hibiscus sabdariffa TaxID=183260 RepID=A0ABR2CVN2_9ROSI